jgi:hypothetical protein
MDKIIMIVNETIPKEVSDIKINYFYFFNVGSNRRID